MTRTCYIRPLVNLWLTEDRFRQDAPPDAELLRHIELLVSKTPRGRLTRLPLRELCLLFFRAYDNLSHVSELGQFLCRQIGRYKEKELMFGLDRLLACRENLLMDGGHRYLVQLTAEEKKPLPDMARRYGITLDSRFYERSQQAYYIQRLKSLAPNQADPLLMEVRSVARTFVEKYRLGHVVIAILIDTLKRSGCRPEALWLDTILAIGGEPRLPRWARSFQMWWVPLGEERLQCMYEWLSEVDLELFLRICRDYIGDSGRKDMARMYPAREKFLRGLFQRKLIRRTRLFLGSRVQTYVEGCYQEKNQLYYTKISGNPDLAVFYLNLGGAHVVEGTFSFTLKIMDRIPSRSVLASYDDTVIDDSLRKGLEAEYEAEFGSTGKLFCYRHMPNGAWRDEAEAALRRLGAWA